MRAFGVAAAGVWAALALWGRESWPLSGLGALGVALAAAVALRPVALAAPEAILAPPRRVFVASCAVVAAGISLWLARGALRDTPLSIDASVYLMQARAMAHLHFGMPVQSPLQSVSHRFVFEGPDGRIYGVFPPGWPLALAPFVWAGVPMLVGPVVAALLVVAQAALGDAVGRAAGDPPSAELATRASLLVALPSYARAFHTAEPMSHGFVALLATVAVTCAIRAREGDAGARRRRGLLLGACVGWAMASRLLDGVVLGLVAGAVLLSTAEGRRAIVWGTAGAAPMLAFLLVGQRAATGAWLQPTQTAYFARSDWPPGCHRLGFGAGVGCTVAHARAVAGFGPNGYDLGKALEVIRARAGAAGEELLGFAPLVLLAFVPVAVGASAVDAIGVALAVVLTLAYGLFYYAGNQPFFGARHLFPAYPFVWLAAARGLGWLPHRARGWLDAAHVRGAGVLVLLSVAAVCSRGLWSGRGHEVSEEQATRSDLRRSLQARGIRRAILKSTDEAEVAAAFDPWADGDERLIVVDDRSGLLELRRSHPDLPVLLSLAGDELGALHPRPPPAGVLVELERSWPAFLRPAGLAASRASWDGASGASVLALTHALPGASVAIPFGVATAGDYLVRVDGFGGPTSGDYALTLDGSPLPAWHGFAPESTPLRGERVPRTLSAGRHTLMAQCLGRDARSSDYDARLDALVGE